MAYITRRDAVYYLNLRLPKSICPRRTTLRLSLGVRDRKTALFLAGSLAFRLHRHSSTLPTVRAADLKNLCAVWLNELHRDTPPTIEPVTHENGPTTSSTSMLGHISRLYMAEGERGGLWRTSSKLETERAIRDFFELMGDMPARKFGVTESRQLKERLSMCPQYFALRPEFDGSTLRQVIDSGKQYKCISPVTVNNRLRKLSAFFNWCQNNGYITVNPLAGTKVMLARTAKEARLSFATDDLEKLLNPKALQHEARKHPWRYWLPLLGRTTGARLEELCQLLTDDIITLQGIPCIRIDDQHESQKLKNEGSRRILPIHPALISIGLLDYVEGLKNQGIHRLFPELEPKRDKLGHAPSKWFGRYRHKLGVSDPRKTFHSFRHTFIDDLKESGVQDSLLKRMVGHTDSSVTFGIYGSRHPLKAMLAAISSLNPYF